MASVIAFGRVSGNATFQYGPKVFDLDWGGVFTSLQIISIVSALPKGLHLAEAHEIPGALVEAHHIHGAGKVAHDTAKDLLVNNLQYLTLEIATLGIQKHIAHWWGPNENSFTLLHLSTAVDPIALLVNNLSNMGLNTWGVLRQICLAISNFTSTDPGSNLSMSFFFTL